MPFTNCCARILNAQYRALASQGINGVLELTELPSLFMRAVLAPPPHALMMHTRARVFRTSDGALIDNLSLLVISA